MEAERESHALMWGYTCCWRTRGDEGWFNRRPKETRGKYAHISIPQLLPRTYSLYVGREGRRRKCNKVPADLKRNGWVERHLQLWPVPLFTEMMFQDVMGVLWFYLSFAAVRVAYQHFMLVQNNARIWNEGKISGAHQAFWSPKAPSNIYCKFEHGWRLALSVPTHFTPSNIHLRSFQPALGFGFWPEFNHFYPTSMNKEEKKRERL